MTELSSARTRAPSEPRRALFAWSLYDWANSPFFAVIGTFVFATYFTQAVAPDPETGAAQWGYTLTLCGLAIAVLSPILGAVADAGGRRKPWLAALTLIGIVGSAALWWVEPTPSATLFALGSVAIATVALEIGIAFYNAMLPDLAPPSRLGRWSGWAWGAGYAGGMVALVLMLGLFVMNDNPPFGLDTERSEHIRVVGPFVALWIALFAWPLFAFVPDQPDKGLGVGETARQGFKQLRATLGHLPRYRTIATFLLARMLYIDGLNTLFAFGGIYAAGTFGMAFSEVILFGIALNVTAGLGAVLFAGVDDRLGAKPTVLIGLAGLSVCGIGALVVTDKTAFWLIGSALGLFIGPVQSASRSLMARLAPVELRTEMFGLYAFSGKATAFLGPFVFATATAYAGTQRAGMATILVFFALGAALLLLVRAPRPPREGHADAR